MSRMASLAATQAFGPPPTRKALRLCNLRLEDRDQLGQGIVGGLVPGAVWQADGHPRRLALVCAVLWGMDGRNHALTALAFACAARYEIDPQSVIPELEPASRERDALADVGPAQEVFSSP